MAIVCRCGGCDGLIPLDERTPTDDDDDDDVFGRPVGVVAVVVVASLAPEVDVVLARGLLGAGRMDGCGLTSMGGVGGKGGKVGAASVRGVSFWPAAKEEKNGKKEEMEK